MSSAAGGAGGGGGASVDDMNAPMAAEATPMAFGVFDVFTKSDEGYKQNQAIIPGSLEYRQLYKVYRLMHTSFYIQGILSGAAAVPYLPDTDPSFINTFQGFLGFDGPNKQGYSIHKYSVAGVFYKDRILSSCWLLEKNRLGQPPLFEIWSLSTNPYFLRTGAAKFLIYKVIEYCGSHTTHKIYLEVARDSFPFISFYDRFLLYCKYGFSPLRMDGYSAKVMAITSTGYTGLNLAEFAFKSDITKEYSEETAYTSINPEGPPTTGSLALFTTKVPIMYPTTDTIIMSLTLSDIDKSRLDAKIAELQTPEKIKKIDISLPSVRYGFLSHSAYQLGESPAVFKTAILPPNVELIIINTPGYNTHSQEVIANWRFNHAYLNNLPLGLLKQYFPGFKANEHGSIPTPHIDSSKGIEFVKATSGSIQFNYMYMEYMGYKAQIHCYGGGDIYPDLELYATLGPTSTDFVSSMYGLHELPITTTGTIVNDIVPRPTGDAAAEAEWDIQRGILIKTTNAEINETNQRTGLPLEQFKIWPLKTTVFEDKKYSYDLSYVIEQSIPKDGKTRRITIFSCGSLEGNPALNAEMVAVSAYRIGQTVSVPDLATYYRMLKTFGEALYEVTGKRNQIKGGRRSGTRRKKRTRGRKSRRRA